ncbi:MAG: hypothetical protein EOP84_07110 [Verrucomicrobiaceae bacterium]|nr:MAG: hypothetical protein EOP84_07110 [Verrucomicrobiaceae bacterium]
MEIAPPATPTNPPEPQGKKGDPKWMITAECQMLVVPQKLAIGLITELGDNEKMEAAWGRVQKLVDEGQIELLALLHLKGDEGGRMVAETVEKVRYPNDHIPPQLPDQGAQPKDVEILKAWPSVGITPTNFQDQNVGQTLELEATVSDDGQWIDTNVVAEHIRLPRWMKFDAGRLANGERISFEQPFFHSMKNIANLRIRNAQLVLVGVHRVPGPDEKSFELFILRVKATENTFSK